jgi:hypothetical protein
MNPTTLAIVVSGGLFAGVLLCLELGNRLGKKEAEGDLTGARTGVGAIEAALFGLLGLMLAFNFNGASTRFNLRRALIVDEANALGTAWLRLDLVQPAAQPVLRDLFRSYLDSRLAVYAKLPDLEAAKAEMVHGAELRRALWSRAVQAAGQPGGEAVQRSLLPALTQMFEVATARTRAFFTHSPPVITAFLVALVMLTAVLAGHGMSAGKQRRMGHRLVFAVITSMTVYLIFDLDYPRYGLIHVGADDQALFDLRASME